MTFGGPRRAAFVRGTLAAALATVVLTAMVPVGSAAAETTLDVEVGVGGHAGPRAHSVVRIRVTADELVDGELVLTRDGIPLTIRQAIEVPAGTTKDALLVVPGVEAGQRLTVELIDQGRVAASEQLRPRIEADVELVGVLPRLLARSDELPESVDLPGRTGRAELAPLSLDVLDLGPIALESYDTIVGSSTDVSALDTTQRRALLRWVNDGGRLLLDDAAALDALPAEWRPGPAGYAWAGRGEVRLTDGAAAAGRWDEIIEPSAIWTDGFGEGDVLFADPQFELAARAGIELPSLTPLIIGLSAYGLVIGPVVYLVLRRARRLTLGWIVIPLLAVVTAGFIVVTGGRYRSGGNPATATFIDTSPGGSVAFTNVLSFSRAGGATRIPTAPGWQLDESGYWTGPATSAFSALPDRSGQLDIGLEAGQVVTSTFAGPVDDQPLAITAAMTADGEVAGTVTNGTAVALHDVAVFVGDRAQDVGTLASGERADWRSPAPATIETSASGADQVWNRGVLGDAASDQLAELGVWGASSRKWELFPTGLARVAGWTDELPPPVRPGDDTSAVTAITAMTPIDPAGRPAEVATVRAVVVRSPMLPVAVDGGFDSQVYRYLLAPGADAAALQLEGLDPSTFSKVAFWDGEDWVDEAVDGDEPIGVPPTAVRSGVVLVRGTFSFNQAALIPALVAAP